MSNFLSIWGENGIAGEESIDIFLNICRNCQTNDSLLTFFENIKNTRKGIYRKFLVNGAWKELCQRYKTAFLSSDGHRFLELFLSLPLTDELVLENEFLKMIREGLGSQKKEIYDLSEQILSKFSHIDKESKRVKPIAPAGVARVKLTKNSRQDMLCEAVVDTDKTEQSSNKCSDDQNIAKQRIKTSDSSKPVNFSTILHESIQTDLNISLDDSSPDKYDHPAKLFEKFNFKPKRSNLPLPSSQIKKIKKSISFNDILCDVKHFKSIPGERINVSKNPNFFKELACSEESPISPNDAQTDEIEDYDIYVDDAPEIEAKSVSSWRVHVLDLCEATHFQCKLGKNSLEKRDGLKKPYHAFEKKQTSTQDSPDEPDENPLPISECRIIIPFENDKLAFLRHTIFR